jgi:hypothetical protein
MQADAQRGDGIDVPGRVRAIRDEYHQCAEEPDGPPFAVWPILNGGCGASVIRLFFVRDQGIDASGNFGQCVISREILSQSIRLFPIF